MRRSRWGQAEDSSRVLKGIGLREQATKSMRLGAELAIADVLRSPGAKATVGRIVGHIDGISQDGDHYFLLGLGLSARAN